MEAIDIDYPEQSLGQYSRRADHDHHLIYFSEGAAMTSDGNRGLFSVIRKCLLAMALFIVASRAQAGSVLFVTDTTTLGPTDLIHAYDAGTGAPIGPDITLLGATGLAIGPNGNLFAVTSNPGFQPDGGSVYQYNSTTHAQIGGPYVTFTGQNDGHDVQGPGGMAFGTTGNLYIADTTESNVHVYGSSNNSLGALTSNELQQPTDVTFDSNGNLYVVSGNADVLRAAGGTGPLSEFVAQQAGGLTIPTSLSFGPDGKLYVLDNGGTPVVRRYDSSGNFDTNIITFNGDLGLFVPTQIEFGPDGKLYISGQSQEVGDGEVLRFLTDGTSEGPFITGLANPNYMVFTPVPEPASWVLGALCAAGLPVYFSRHRAASTI
jgi:sugar lactone lactonase YvrE